MASPMPSQPTGGWNNHGQAMHPQPQQQQEDSGVQVRSVGLKVLYKFNREDKFDCLARPSQTFSVQTIPIDESTTIGVIDLRACIQAVVEGSPELPGRECDYTIYAHDYSEPDTPLVGQGSLSMAIASLNGEMGGEPKMVTGLLTKNKLGLLMGKNSETLEVKMKFTETQRAFQPHSQPHQAPQHPQQQRQYSQPPPEIHQHNSFSQQGSFDRSLTPTGATEWNSFIQSNPQLGQRPTFSRGASPALSQNLQQQTHSRRNSFIQHPIPQAQNQLQQERIAPVPAEPPSETGAQGQASRPSSRASNRGAPRKKIPTGRPVGRPRKKPAAQGNPGGNTSGYEDGTEGEEGPIKKRAKVTHVDTVNNNPFGSEPDSLRVAASTSGSLRNFRPVGLASEGSAGNHLQEVPRAPTPVPKGPFRGGGANKKKARGSAMRKEISQTSPPSQPAGPPSPGLQDDRSPESLPAQTPAYSEDSPAEIGSSPPVPRTASFMRSSPPPSSPMLPPMPVDQAPPTDTLEAESMTDLMGEDVQAAAMQRPVPRSTGVRQSKKLLPRPADISTPMQVWRMEDGPDGTQDLVHVHSYNQPNPTEPPKTHNRPLAPQPPAVSKGRPPMMPTPPATTDATEKPTSPPLSDPAQAHNSLGVPGPPALPLEQPVQSHSEKPTSPPTEQQTSQLQPTPETEPTGLAYPQPYFVPMAQGVPDPTEQFQRPDLPQMPSPAPQEQTGQGNPQAASALPLAGDQTEAEAGPAQKKKAPAKSRPSRARAPAKPRKLARSQSAGNLAAVPASEPAGPSSLSQSVLAAPEPPTADPPAALRRAQSIGPLNVPVPASDPVGPSTGLALPMLALPEPIQPTIEPPSDAVPDPSSPRTTKNTVKRNAIKQRLEAAIKRGEMPPFCCNCGAIETPTWRKIFCQEHEGAPPLVRKEDMGTKPGMVSILEVLSESTEEEPGRYRIVKKSLDPATENADDWLERLLCNPCGIWLGKTLSYRPQDRWTGDAERLGKTRKRKPSEPGGSKPKRSRSKSTTQPPVTSEAIAPETDIPAAAEETPVGEDSAIMREGITATTQTLVETTAEEPVPAAEQQQPGSSHSSGDGSAKSPIDIELDAAMGTTKRLLFPSPRKDNSPIALSDLDVNIVHTGDFRPRKETVSTSAAEKQTQTPTQDSAGKNSNSKQSDDLDDLFNDPIPRPCTPPSASKTGVAATPFKTPTRATPSHRPITRSVSRSLRSKGSILESPSAAFNRTPSRTPSKISRDEYTLPSSAFRRPSPRQQILVDLDERLFDTPMSRAMNQMLSEPNFGLEDDEIDLVPASGAEWDTFNIFSTDGPLPSSPPRHTRFEESWEVQPKEWRDFLCDIQAAASEGDEERE